MNNYLKTITVSFTGRRPRDLVGYDINNYKQFVDDLSQYICQLYEQGYLRFITGGAQGFDQLVFWAVDKAKSTYPDIQNICYIPFRGVDSQWKDKGLFGRADFDCMLRHCDGVRYIAKENTTAAYHWRNAAMCKDSSLCIALFPDDSWRTIDRGSGTAACMKFAADTGMQMKQICYQIVSNQLQFGTVADIQ